VRCFPYDSGYRFYADNDRDREQPWLCSHQASERNAYLANTGDWKVYATTIHAFSHSLPSSTDDGDATSCLL